MSPVAVLSSSVDATAVAAASVTSDTVVFAAWAASARSAASAASVAFAGFAGAAGLDASAVSVLPEGFDASFVESVLPLLSADDDACVSVALSLFFTSLASSDLLALAVSSDFGTSCTLDLAAVDEDKDDAASALAACASALALSVMLCSVRPNDAPASAARFWQPKMTKRPTARRWKKRRTCVTSKKSGS